VDYNDIGWAASGTYGDISNSAGFSYGPNNLFGTNPSFANATAPGAPNCSSASSVPNCMATVIADFAPTASGGSAYGYQVPTAAPVYDPLFPQWLCNVNLPSGLVTIGCLGVPPSLFGLTVLDFEARTPSMPFGTTRSWDASNLDNVALDWADVNRSAYSYDFTNLDAFIALNRARGADIIYTFGRTPSWASSQPNAPGFYSPGECAPPTEMSTWDNFVTAIATHAAGQIKYWEIWNEPDLTGTYCGDIPTMVTMAQHASQIIKGIDPSAIILSPGVTSVQGPAWLDSFLSGGAADSVDVIAFHGYSGADAEDIVDVISSYKTVMAANGVAAKPMWDTESSWGGANTLTSSQQVGFVAKYYLLHWSQGVSRFVWYAYDPGIWGGLTIADGGETPAAASYSQVHQWMVGAFMATPCAADPVGIWTCTLTRPGGYTAEAVWISNTTASFTVPAQYAVYRDLTGAIHTISGNTLTVGDQPILLETTDLSSLAGNSPAP
jgi:hypothetical protein